MGQALLRTIPEPVELDKAERLATVVSQPGASDGMRTDTQAEAHSKTECIQRTIRIDRETLDAHPSEARCQEDSVLERGRNCGGVKSMEDSGGSGGRDGSKEQNDWEG
jgi:hypothetical protein